MENLEKHDTAKEVKRFGEYGSHIDRVIDPKNATLKEIVESEYYPLRKIDIERLSTIAREGADKKPENVIRVLDLGGGKGLLSKLLAENLTEEGVKSMVINLDKHEKRLRWSAHKYKDPPNLKFIVSDIEKEAPDIFKTNFDLVIVSWAHSLHHGGGAEYSQTVKHLKPAFFVNIGESEKNFTGFFEPGEEYKKVGEWGGPFSDSIPRGYNLFEIYARADIDKSAIEKLKNELKKVEQRDLNDYHWETELKEIPQHLTIEFKEKK